MDAAGDGSHGSAKFPTSIGVLCEPDCVLKVRKVVKSDSAKLFFGFDLNLQSRAWRPRAQLDLKIHNLGQLTLTASGVQLSRRWNIKCGQGSCRVEAHLRRSLSGQATVALEVVPTKLGTKMLGAGLSLAAGRAVDLSPNVSVPRVPPLSLQVHSSAYRTSNNSQLCLDIEQINPTIVL
ncbi:hypothetical protein CYMTET_23513 [Cymbomonas tetramitiformis]|uniref:Uncharacterized protein n=1 Tax=Cymbomonas tetramitiformis TaxID=36881 RepID=A0AAE0L0W0_9CHLO|nr:hypothetical protein CYMTET_23513 [Cymbomonas tetramitiformis]